MQVRLLTGRVGRGFTQRAGDVIELSAGEAKRLIDSGQAEPAHEGRSAETATRERGSKRAATRSEA